MELKNLYESKTVRGVIAGLLAAAVLLGIFTLGTMVGSRRARFGDRFGENYERNLVGPRGEGPGFPGRPLPPGGHGAAGQIVSVSLPSLVVAGPDKLEKTIIVAEDTLIREFREDRASSDLKVGDFIVVLGQPNEEGQITAKLIRLMPAPNEKGIPQN